MLTLYLALWITAFRQIRKKGSKDHFYLNYYYILWQRTFNISVVKTKSHKISKKISSQTVKINLTENTVACS